MKKIVTFRSEIRATTLLCSSLAILLTACGGADPAAAGQAQQTQAAASVSSAAASAQPADAQGMDMNAAPAAAATPAESAPAASAQASAAPAAPAQASAASEANFALSGYENGPFVEDNGSQPATSVAASTTTVLAASTTTSAALADGTVTPAVVVPATTYKLYVSPSGNDYNSGSATSPFRTLARAARSTRPSTTVFVAPGTYSGGFKTSIRGSSSGHIYYVSTTKWGARIVGSSSTSYAWDNRGNYVDIVGFQVDGTGATWRNGIYNGGSYDTIRGNWVHHIGKSAACNGSGGSAINIDHYYYGVQSNIVGNLVHDIGPTGCRYIQGLYVSTTGTVKNNVVYRVAEAAIHLWHDARSVYYTRTGTPNLRLTSSSPAIGRATSVDALPYDFLERPRNSTTGYDIGAYQH